VAYRELRFGVRKALLHACVVLLLGTAFVVSMDGSASAACSGQVIHGAIGVVRLDVEAPSPTVPNYGNSARVWVNDFNSNQHQTWRSVIIIQNANNLVEIGWYTEAGQTSHPYKTWVDSGVFRTAKYGPGYSLSQDTYHKFQVNDSDDDDLYDFSVDDQSLGASILVTIGVNHAEAWSQSERRCTKDSLWTHVKNLRYIRAKNGAFRDWPQHLNNVNTNASPYRYCGNGTTNEFRVKQTC
jgi:hypothetical protein